MKRSIIAALAAVSSLTLSAQQLTVIQDGLRFCEGTVPYKNTVLVSNFGGDELDPLNTKGLGYIVSISGDNVTTLIPAAGFLSAPKGMAVLSNHLVVADVGRVAIFDLRKPKNRPTYVKLADDDLFANDVAVMGELILVSVTNTGRIYAIDLTDIEAPGKANQIGKVPGANGLAVNGTNLYVTSYDPNENPTAANVIYFCDLTNVKQGFKPLIKDLAGGQYDGVAVDMENNRIYFSSWSGRDGGAIYSYSLEGNEPARVVDFGIELKGPADISIVGDMIYIPDLPKSKVYRFKL